MILHFEVRITLSLRWYNPDQILKGLSEIAYLSRSGTPGDQR